MQAINLLTTCKLRVRQSFAGESQTNRSVITAKARLEIFPLKMEHLGLISCYVYNFLVWFCRAVTDQWAVLYFSI